MSETEETLAARVAQKDSAALAEFIEVKRPQLLAFIERNLSTALKRKIEAQDLVQETAIDALRSLSAIELGDRDPFSWLCQIAERRIIDAHRKFFGAQKRAADREVSGGPAKGAQSQMADLMNLIVVTMTTPSQAFSRDAREFRLSEALKELPEESREALRLRYVEGLPTKDIAARIGKSDGAVRVMLTRSLDRLHGILGDDAPRS